MYQLQNGLHNAGHTLKVVAVNTPKYNISLQSVPETYISKFGYEQVFIDTSLYWHHALINLFSNTSYHVSRFYSAEMVQRLENIFKNEAFDIIQLETAYMGIYLPVIRKYSQARVVLRAHNIEHIIWKRLTDKCTNPLKKWYLKLLTARLKKFELDLFDKVDGIACITEIDRNLISAFGCKTMTEVITFGVDTSATLDTTNPSDRMSFYTLGSMDWLPNIEGVKWFLDSCMPFYSTLDKKWPVNIAGRNMPDWVYKYKFVNLNVVGEVDNAADFIKLHNVMLAPLLSGGGIRIKILEAMMYGKTVISTTIGAEGIQYTDGLDILIADTPLEFVEKMKYCISNPGKCKEIGENARKLINRHHDLSNITQKLAGFYQKIK